MLDRVAVVLVMTAIPLPRIVCASSQEERESIKGAEGGGERLSEASRKIDRCQKQIEGEIKELDRKMVMKAVGNHIESIRERFGAMEKSLFISMSF